MNTPVSSGAVSDAQIDVLKAYSCCTRRGSMDSPMEWVFTEDNMIDGLRAVLALTQPAVPVVAEEPFGYWHQGATEEESDFFLHKDSGDVRCETCIPLYAAPQPTPSAESGGLSELIGRYKAGFLTEIGFTDAVIALAAQGSKKP